MNFKEDGSTYNFNVKSEIERLNYLITASEENTKCFVSILNEEKKEIYSFESTMFLTGQDDLELVWENPKDVDISLLKRNSILRIDFYLHGIETHADCFLRHCESEANNIILNISGPFRMTRLQRRVNPRVNLSTNFTAKVHLNKNKEHLSNLLAINISEGGIAILVNAPLEDVRKNIIYNDSVLELPLKMNNVFTLPMKIAHVRSVSKALLPKILSEKKTIHPWFQVGIKFMAISQKLEQSIKMVINQIK